MAAEDLRHVPLGQTIFGGRVNCDYSLRPTPNNTLPIEEFATARSRIEDSIERTGRNGHVVVRLSGTKLELARLGADTIEKPVVVYELGDSHPAERILSESPVRV